MLDTTTPIMQRTRGRAAVSFACVAGITRLGNLHQSGSAKAMLPATHGGAPEVVFLNTAGGLTGGDRLDYRLDLGAGCAATATTQTAERAYASTGATARVDISLTAGKGARLDWIPQETILFDASALHRATTIDLAETATLLTCETVVLGRAAMGEALDRLDFTDRRVIRRAGRPVLIEPLRLDTRTLARRHSPATLASARALATIHYLAPDAEDRLEAIRALLPGTAAASAWNGRLSIRAMAGDAFPLRRLMARILTELRGCPLPRVWQV